MKLVKGDLFTFSGDFLLVTTNSTVKKDGSLVMGRGAALQAAQRWPNLPKQFGAMTQEAGRNYSIVLAGGPYDCDYLFVGAFQVKHHFRDSANLQLITDSTMWLSSIARCFPRCTFALNFPGIGNGRLEREQVLPIIQQLPDNVYVYEL